MVKARVGPMSSMVLTVEEEVLSSSSIGIWCGGVCKAKGVGVGCSFGMEIMTSSLSEVCDGVVDVDGVWTSGWELEMAVPKS